VNTAPRKISVMAESGPAGKYAVTTVMKKMDRLDRITLLAVLALAVAISVLVATYPADVPSRKQLQQQQVQDPQLTARLRLARDMLASSNLKEAARLIGELLDGYPYNGHVHMLQADIFILRQQPLAAMLEQRRAVDLNPDFLDRRTPDFQGKKIKNTLREAWEAINAGNLPPAEVEEYRRVYYYMQRKLAGSCG